MKTDVASAADLLAWSYDPSARETHSPLQAPAALLFEATPLAAADTLRVASWLRHLPCPSIAIASQPSSLSDAADVVVASADDAAPLLARTARNPIAAAVLVQVLRLVEQLPLAAALTAESLAYSTLQAGPEYRRWLAAHRASALAPHSETGPAVLMRREQTQLKLSLNRASKRNAMSVEMRDALIEALQLVLADDSIERVRLDGLGACFSTGGDLAEFGSAPDPATAHVVRSLALPGRLLAACAARVEVHVHGACIGSGIELPAFAGRLVATSDAWFQLPELAMGLIPGAGGCISIARRIGRQRTALMALTGRRIKAEQALAWGLVDAVVATL